jgi:hypothetical protein
MSLFLLLIVLVALLLAAIWWNPRRTVSSSVAVPSLFASLPGPGSPAITERDTILNEEIQIIEDLIRQDDADKRRAAALDRLATIQAIAATKRKA